MKDNKEKNLKELEEEKMQTEESIKKLTEEINTKRRNLAEMKNKLVNLKDKIKAASLDNVSNAVTENLGIDIEMLMEAIKSRKVKVDSSVLGEVQRDDKDINGMPKSVSP